MNDLSPQARLLLRYMGQALHLRTNAWCEAPKDSHESAAELERHDYLVKYNTGFRLTEEGIRHLLTTKTRAPDEPDPAEELARMGYPQEAIQELLSSLDEQTQ